MSNELAYCISLFLKKINVVVESKKKLGKHLGKNTFYRRPDSQSLPKQ